MSNLTMPTLTVAFKQRASTSVARSQKGVVAFLIRDAAADAADLKYTLTSSAQIPQTLGTANQAAIRGSLLELPQFSHENHGNRFYRFVLEVPRLSGAVDHLPVIAREEVLNQMDLSGGERIEVRGQVRSFNNHSPTGQRLLIFVFASSVQTSR